MTDKKPATKATRKRPTITTPRLFNAVEDIIIEAGLNQDSTIGDLYTALDAKIVKDARAK